MRGASPSSHHPSRGQDMWSRVNSACYSRKQSCSTQFNQTQLTWRSTKTNAYFCPPLRVDRHFSWPSQLILHMPVLHPGLLLWMSVLCPFLRLSRLHCLDCATMGSVAISGHRTSTVFPDCTRLEPESGITYTCKLPQASVTEWGNELCIQLTGCWRWVFMPVTHRGLENGWSLMSTYCTHLI